MTVHPIDHSQRKAARFVGFAYLFGFIAVFNEVYVRPSLIVPGNPGDTARNIMAHEQLFRLGMITDLLCFASIAVVLTGSYVVLRPVSRGLALLGASWRLLEASTLIVMTLSSFTVLRLLTSPDYAQTFSVDQVQTLARLFVGARPDDYNFAEIFLGLGSTVFAYLWFKSHYVPRALAAWGIFASLLVAVSTCAIVLFPDFQDISFPWVYLPIAIFELTMGFWLSIRGLPPSEGIKSRGHDASDSSKAPGA